MEEKDLRKRLPDEPSYKERVRRKHDEEFGKLKPSLRELAELAADLTDYYEFGKDVSEKQNDT